MRTNINTHALIALLLLVFNVVAQEKNKARNDEQPDATEKYNLIETLRASHKTQITFKASALPQQTTFKLFLESRLDFALEKSLKAWVYRWNKKQGMKFGQLTFVKNIKQADVILVRFQDLQEVVEETVTTGAIRNPHLLVGSTQTTNFYSPFYSYILLPKTDGFEIIWRHRKLSNRDVSKSRGHAPELIKALTERLQKH